MECQWPQEFHTSWSAEFLMPCQYKVMASGKARGGVLKPRDLKVSRVVVYLWTVCDSVVSGDS